MMYNLNGFIPCVTTTSVTDAAIQSHCMWKFDIEIHDFGTFDPMYSLESRGLKCDDNDAWRYVIKDVGYYLSKK